MHLVMFMKDKQARAGVIDGEDIVDINAADRSLPPTLKGILEANGLSRVKKIIKSKKHRVPRKRAKLLPPISNPGLLLSVGMNYHEHLKEMKTPVPEKPAAFTKSVASIIASGQPIMLPPSQSEHGRLGRRVHRGDRQGRLPHPGGEGARSRRRLHHRQRRLGARLGGGDLLLDRRHGPDPRLGAQPARQDDADLLPDGPVHRDQGRSSRSRRTCSIADAPERPGDAGREHRRPGVQRREADRVLLAVLPLPARRRASPPARRAASASAATRRCS